MQQQPMSIVEGALMPSLPDIVTPNTPLDDELVSLTLSSVIDSLRELYHSTTFRMIERGIVVTELDDEVIAFFCGIMRSDPYNFNIYLADGMIKLQVSTLSAYSELNIWLMLQKIIKQYRMLLDVAIHIDDSEFSIKQLLAS